MTVNSDILAEAKNAIETWLQAYGKGL